MSLDELIRQRRDKIARWRAIGVPPFAYSYDPTHQSAELLAWGDAVTQEPGEVVRIAGRVMTLRGHGKAGFAHLLDGSGRIQVYFKAEVLGEHFGRYELLDVGDWAGIEGPVFRTRTGEITVRADRVELLAKSLRPLPEKWHGLRDPETRYRQRYADLFVNLEVREVFRRRARMIGALRAGLEAHGFLEVETPVLQPLYGGAFARPFATRHHALDMDRLERELRVAGYAPVRVASRAADRTSSARAAIDRGSTWRPCAESTFALGVRSTDGAQTARLCSCVR